MASLDDNPVLEKSTSFRVGSWIFIADGSGGFESYPIDQNHPEALEVASHHKFDDFIDQLKEVGFSALNDETGIQHEFGAIRAETLSELEEELEKLLEDTKQETPLKEKAPPSNYIRFAESSLQKKKKRTSFKKSTRRKKPSKDIF